MEDQRREKDNPFQPISLDERLSRPVPKTRHTAHEPMMMRPGQLYGRTPFYQPAVMGSPAPTEPASPQTIPFSSFQPFGSVNASVAPMQPEPFASPSFRPVEEIQPAAPSEPTFQPLWQSPMEGSPAEKAVEESPSPEYIPESQRPVEKDALGVPKYLQRSPSLGKAQPRNWVPSVSTTAETTAPAAEWPSLDVPLWPMTKPVPLEEQSAPETNAAEENTPQSASESEMPVSATKPEKIAKVETSADAPGEAPLSNKAENTETVQSLGHGGRNADPLRICRSAHSTPCRDGYCGRKRKLRVDPGNGGRNAFDSCTRKRGACRRFTGNGEWSGFRCMGQPGRDFRSCITNRNAYSRASVSCKRRTREKDKIPWGERTASGKVRERDDSTRDRAACQCPAPNGRDTQRCAATPCGRTVHG